MLKQPHSQPKIIELQIVLVAFGTLGVLDLVPLEKVKFVIYYASFLVNFLFKSTILNILILSKRGLIRLIIRYFTYNKFLLLL